MSVSTIIVFAIGAVLALFGLYVVITGYLDIMKLIIGLVILAVGVVLLVHKQLSL